MRKYFFIGMAGAFLLLPLAAGAIEIKSPIGVKAPIDFVDGLINISFMVILPIAVIILMIAAFFILTARGDSEKISRGKKMLTSGLIGLVIVIVGGGSGLLLRNIFGIKDIAFEKDIMASVNLDVQLQVCGAEIDQAKEQLAQAQQSGDTKAVKSLSDIIKDAEEKQSDLEKQKQEADAQSQALAYKYAESLDINIYDEEMGRYALETNNTKDGQGFYNMAGGGNFNPDTKEYIDTSGKSHTNCTLLYDGSILYK